MIEYGDVVVVGNATGEIRALDVQTFSGKQIVDLARLFGRAPDGVREYEGICW